VQPSISPDERDSDRPDPADINKLFVKDDSYYSSCGDYDARDA
jgi:hypothetical protein